MNDRDKDQNIIAEQVLKACSQYMEQLKNTGSINSFDVVCDQGSVTGQADPNILTVSVTIQPVRPIRSKQETLGVSDDFIDRYFPDSVDYPRDMPWNFRPNVYYCYVSSTLLDGFINYVKIKAAGVITRYVGPDEIESYDGKVGTSKQVKLEQFNAGLSGYHTNLGQFGDDVMVIGRISDQDGEQSDEWAFFWFDQDVSDCCIGRFTTDDPEEDVMRRFITFVEERSANLGYTEGPTFWLDIKQIRGWVSF